MTKQEQNQYIKDALVRGLQNEKSIPENIGNIFKNWLIGKIQQASSQLTDTNNVEQEQEQDTQSGGN